jgi:HEPN domain-containing protein
VRSWLKKAAGDLRGADIDLAASPPFIEDMLFHCQQAAEKSMKGFLTAQAGFRVAPAIVSTAKKLARKK